MPKLCELGCRFRPGIPHHRFPSITKNLDYFKEWVQIVGGKLENESDYLHFKDKVICDIHFTANVKVRNRRLSRIAVPTLNLNGSMDYKPSPEVSDKSEPILDPLSTSNKSQTDLSNHVTSIKVIQSESILDMPSEFDESNLTGMSDEETSTQVIQSELILDLPSTTNKFHMVTSDREASKEFPSPIFKDTSKSKGPDRDSVICLKEHNYFANEKADTVKVKGLSCKQLITPIHSTIMVNQLISTRKKVKQLQCEVRRLRKRNATIRTKLVTAKKNSKHNCLQRITQNMTAAAKVFTEMQFTETQKKNSGRRFTSEGQQLCTSIYRSSPRCYKLLSQIFTLPCAKTVKRFIRQQIETSPELNITNLSELGCNQIYFEATSIECDSVAPMELISNLECAQAADVPPEQESCANALCPFH